MSELDKEEKKNQIKFTKKWFSMKEGKNCKYSLDLLSLPELLGEKMKRKERRFYNKNKEILESLFEKLVETTAKTFHIHVSGDLNKLDVEKLIKFAEENNGSDYSE